jgi:CheY-like chemotaxis protein
MSTTRLIAITGYGRAEDVTKAKEAGFDEHLVKPIDVADLERVMAALKSR